MTCHSRLRGLAALVVLCAPLSAPASRDGGAADRPDGQLQAADGGVPPVNAEADQARQELEAEIAALRGIASGQKPEGLSLQQLFDVDLLDERAVAARVLALRERLAPADLEPVDAGAPDAGDPGDVGEPADAGDPGDVGEPADAGDPGDVGEPGDAEEGLEPGGPDPLRALEVERDRLRLAFLERSVDERAHFLEGERQRRQLARELAEARQAQVDAEAARRRAEEQRQVLLAKAAEATTAAAGELAAESARVEAQRGSLTDLQRLLADERTRDAEEAAARFERRRGLETQARAERLGGPAADALYETLVNELVKDRAAFQQALDRLDDPGRGGVFKAGLDPGAPAYQDLGTETAALRRAIAEVDAEAGRLDREDQQQRWGRAAALSTDVEKLNALRIELLPRLSPAKRDDVLGLTRQGIAQLGREADQVRLMARWYPRQRLSAVRSLPSLLNDFFALGVVTWTGLKLVLLIGLAVALRRRSRDWMRVLRAAAFARISGRGLRLLVDRWLGHLSAVAVELGLLVAAYGFFLLVRQLGTAPEIDVAQALVVAYAWYRLALASAHRFLTAAAATRRVEVTHAISERILRSIRLVARFVYVVVILLFVSRKLLGQGYLYTVVVDFFWIGGIPIAYVLLRHWREDITSSYLRTHPTGRLSTLVARFRGSPMGVVLVLAAFVDIALRAAGGWLLDLVLGFVQIRKALAYLFRRRLEKQAQLVGHASVRPEDLPAPLREAFSEEPVLEDLAIDHFPQRAEARQQLERFAAGAETVLLALVGQRGAGKTSWMGGLASGLRGVEVRHHTLASRVTTVPGVCRVLSEAAGVAPAETPAALVAALSQGERRVVMLDLCQNLMLGAVDGFRGFDAFTDVAGRTLGRVAWVCSFSKYTWEHVRNVTRGLGAFQSKVELRPWDEATLGECIERRMQRAGFTASYDDLVVEGVDGASFSSEVVRTRERYLQLLWHYSDGNPRVALHFWLRSLVPDGAGRVRVRLFQAPTTDALDALPEAAWFVLASLVRHENLTVEQAAASLALPRCEALLVRLRALGYLDEQGGVYRVTTHWYLAVLRFLRRKHLLFS